MKWTICILLILSMLFSLLSGCGSQQPEASEMPPPAESARQTETAAPESTVPPTAKEETVPSSALEAETSAAETRPETTPADAETESAPAEETTEVPPETTSQPASPNASIRLSWQSAFRSSSLPEGVITTSEIAFYRKEAENSITVFNVSKEEVFSFRDEYCPRTPYFESLLPEHLRTLFLAVDYALAHECTRLCIPTAEFNYGDILDYQSYLNKTYLINGKGVQAQGIKEFALEDGRTLTYMLVTVSGLSTPAQAQKYWQGLAAAREIVKALPEGLCETETVLSLYRYLTDNVRYDHFDYYQNAGNMLYDTLISHSTVCAGYAEAFSVLCNMAGIECLTVSGYISNKTPGAEYNGNHIWNMAKMDGQYYQFDATWDAGLPVSGYLYCAVSDAWPSKYVETFAVENNPACPQSLFPDVTLDFGKEGILELYWYYRMMGARETDPMDIFGYFYLDGEYQAGEEKDGWVTTDCPYWTFLSLSRLIMTPEEAERFCEGYFREAEDGKMMYRVPDGTSGGIRLTNYREEEDGSLLTTFYRVQADGTFVPMQQRITLEMIGSFYYIAAAKPVD